MPEKRSCLRFRRIGAIFLLFCTCFAGSLLAGSISLPVVNPGFEQGMSSWQEFKTCDGFDCYVSSGIIPYGYPGNHVFSLAYGHGCDPECFSNDYRDTVFQGGILMPSDDDVRWNFWIKPVATYIYPPYWTSPPFDVQIGIFDASGRCTSDCLTFEVKRVNGQLEYDFFGSSAWGSASFIYGGYYVKSDNLAKYFTNLDTLGVSFSVSGKWSTDGDHEYYQWMSGYVDDGPPTPEPNSILLLGSGILGLAGLMRCKPKAAPGCAT